MQAEPLQVWLVGSALTDVMIAVAMTVLVNFPCPRPDFWFMKYHW